MEKRRSSMEPRWKLLRAHLEGVDDPEVREAIEQFDRVFDADSTILDLHDDEAGRWLRRIAQSFEATFGKEVARSHNELTTGLFTTALISVAQLCIETNATHYSGEVTGTSYQDVDTGDWRITVDRIDPENGEPYPLAEPDAPGTSQQSTTRDPLLKEGSKAPTVSYEGKS